MHNVGRVPPARRAWHHLRTQERHLDWPCSYVAPAVAGGGVAGASMHKMIPHPELPAIIHQFGEAEGDSAGGRQSSTRGRSNAHAMMMQTRTRVRAASVPPALPYLRAASLSWYGPNQKGSRRQEKSSRRQEKRG